MTFTNLKIGLIIILFSNVLFLTNCNRDQDQQDLANQAQPAEEPPRSIVMNVLPDYIFQTLNGESLRLEDYRGSVILLNFWATWCGPCRREIPELIKLKERYADKGFEIIGISLDEEGFKLVEPFLEQFEVNYVIVHDDQTYSEQIGGIFALPTTYVVDRQGIVISRMIGEITAESIEPTLMTLFE